MLAASQSLTVDPGAQATSTITAAPPSLEEQLTWRLIDDSDGSIAQAESSASIVAIDDGHDFPRQRYDRPFTAPVTPGRYLAIWRYFQDEVAQSIVVSGTRSASFATTDDVAARLGRTLTGDETSNVEFLLNMAAVAIADAAGYDDGWAVSLSPVPEMLRLMSVELACRAMVNPSGYDQIMQQVGSYRIQVSQSVKGMVLSDAETLMIRRAVHGRTTDSTHVDAGFERAQDEYWLRKQSVRYSDPGEVIP